MSPLLVPTRWRTNCRQREARVASSILANGRYDLIVFRVDALPLAPIWIVRRHKVPYVIKTLGRGTLNALQGRGLGLGKIVTPTQRSWSRRSSTVPRPSTV